MIPITSLQNVVSAFRAQSQEAARRAISTMQQTDDDLIATGYVATAGTYELCARALESIIGEWSVPMSGEVEL